MKFHHFERSVGVAEVKDVAALGVIRALAHKFKVSERSMTVALRNLVSVKETKQRSYSTDSADIDDDDSLFF